MIPFMPPESVRARETQNSRQCHSSHVSYLSYESYAVLFTALG